MDEVMKQRVRELSAQGWSTNKIAQEVHMSSGSVYNALYPERAKEYQKKQREKARLAIKGIAMKPTPKKLKDTKQFKVTVSGIVCILNIPQSMGLETEVTSEALIFNIV